MANNIQNGGITLLNARTTDGSGGFVTWDKPQGKASFQRAGNFDGATITLNALAPDNATSIALTTATVGGAVQVEGLVEGQQYECVVSNDGASTSVSAWLLAVN